MAKLSPQIKKYLSPISFYKKKILCRAPFTSLILFLNGDILICCANKEFVIGRYPEDNLHSAWFGEKIKEFRKSILSFDLSKGCHECVSQIESENFTSVKAGFYNHLPINKNGYPSQLEFVLDNTCNLECIMCDSQTSSAINRSCRFIENNESPNKYSGILEDIVEFAPFLEHANFIGGEPFLSSLYYNMWEKMLTVNNNIRINISTNGTILNEKIKAILSKGFFDIAVSVDSINKETYENIRKNARMEEVLTNIEFFKNYCDQKKTYFSIWVCPMIPNAYEIPELFEHFNNRNVSVFFNTVTMPHTLSIRNLGPAEISNIINYYSENKPTNNNENEKRFHDLISLLKSWQIFAKDRECLEKEIGSLSSEAILHIYVSMADRYLDELYFKGDQKVDLLHKINYVLNAKNVENRLRFMKFLITLPIQESTHLLLKNSTEHIEYYTRMHL